MVSRDRGTSIFARYPSGDIPSIRAASAKETGTVKKSCLSKRSEVALARKGKMRAKYVSIQPRVAINLYVGTMRTAKGSMCVIRMRPKKKAFPLN
jgi:hypothetical protein